MLEDSPAVMATAVDLHLPSGRIAAEISGPDGGPLVVCVHGITANLRSYDPLAAHLAARGHRVVAIDLRGRGCSETTPRGSYGWPAHARDVLAVADALGAERFDLVGHSMGAFVSMQAATLDGSRLQRVVLVDGIGIPEQSSLGPIAGAFQRLGVVFPSAGELVGKIRSVGAVEPWSETWQRMYEYELEQVPGGVRSRTDLDACVEDATWGTEHDAADLWPGLTMPVLLVRAERPIMPGLGYIVGADLRDRFLDQVATASLVEIDANHYTVITNPATADAVAAFLS